MKALITAFALLSFVAASTVPMITPTQARTTHHVTKKKVKHTKHVAAHKKVRHGGSKMKKPAAA
ncbi:MAG TPA: hypothetical protein VLX85_02055 [Stellaceae bacterium]|nr:hypothetical protein [Stellaceae bacterium]